MSQPPVSRPAPITTVAEWDGGSHVWVSATQLSTAYTATDARRIVSEWCELGAPGRQPAPDPVVSGR